MGGCVPGLWLWRWMACKLGGVVSRWGPMAWAARGVLPQETTTSGAFYRLRSVRIRPASELQALGNTYVFGKKSREVTRQASLGQASVSELAKPLRLVMTLPCPCQWHPTDYQDWGATKRRAGTRAGWYTGGLVYGRAGRRAQRDTGSESKREEAACRTDSTWVQATRPK
ncbi:hypothetical protein EV126DRAFT_157825 [Verticillium dahliae]|nr:hypothetical protein EV126DRAFT_157825 [Verticillium dahliae]